MGVKIPPSIAQKQTTTMASETTTTRTASRGGGGKTMGMSAVVESVKTARDRYEDNTDWIRHAKNADKYRSDVHAIMAILARRVTAAAASATAQQQLPTLGEDEMNEVFVECKAAAPALFREMQVVFTKLLTNQLDIPIFFKLLDTLERIERGEMDQEEGSETVGKLLYRSFGNGPRSSSSSTNDVDGEDNTREKGDGKDDAAAASSGSSSSGSGTAVVGNPSLTWKEYAAAKNLQIMTQVHRQQTIAEHAKETHAKMQKALARAKAKSGRR